VGIQVHFSIGLWVQAVTHSPRCAAGYPLHPVPVGICSAIRLCVPYLLITNPLYLYLGVYCANIPKSRS